MEIAEKSDYILGIKIFIKRDKEIIYMADAEAGSQKLSALYINDHIRKWMYSGENRPRIYSSQGEEEEQGQYISDLRRKEQFLPGMQDLQNEMWLRFYH